MKRKIAILMAVVLLMLCFSGCANMVQQMENAEVRAAAEGMLDALIAGDADAGYALAGEGSTRQKFMPVFEDLSQVLRGVEEYELDMLAIGTRTTISDGERTEIVRSAYEMTAGTERYIVVLEINSRLGLSGFEVAPYEQTDYYFTGTLGRMEEANGVQWALLLSNILSVGLAVAAVADCCRHRIKNKGLWITGLILGFMTLSVKTAASAFGIHFSFGWILNYSALIRYGGGTQVLRLLFPVVAIVYFILRRRLLKQDAPETADPV